MHKAVINPQYFPESVRYNIAVQFQKEKSIQLKEFLLPHIATRTLRSVRNAPLSLNSVAGQNQFHAFKKIPLPAKTLLQFVRSQRFAQFVSSIAQKKVACKTASWRVFAHGDYTLLHDKNREPPGIDVILDLTPSWDGRACGHHSYVENGKGLVRIPPGFNTLAIVQRPKSVMKFVKYVNHHAGRNKRFVLEARFG